MAINKNALIRYKVLDNCFRNTGRQYFIKDLIDECNKLLFEIDPDSSGISLRQIRDDIAFMKSKEGWSIELGEYRVGRKMYYRYSDPSFSINNMPLNEVEINQLRSAVNILSQFKGMPQFEWVNELLPKLQQGMASDEDSNTVMEFDNNRYLTGIDHLGTLYNAIFYKKVLSISYRPFENDEPFKIIIHPYFLKQYNNRWFLFGYNPENEKYDWNLAIDRIYSISESGNEYHENSAIDWIEYFEDVIGVTKPINSEVEEIILHFSGRTGHYMQTKPLHGSQRSNWLTKDKLEVKLNLIINYELERLILSYADSVLVISPRWLNTSIVSKLQTGIERNK